MPKDRRKNAPTKSLSFDLTEERTVFLLMSIRGGEQMVQKGDVPIPVLLPEGCIGVMLVFDTQEAADKYQGRPAETVQLTRTT